MYKNYVSMRPRLFGKMALDNKFIENLRPITDSCLGSISSNYKSCIKFHAFKGLPGCLNCCKLLLFHS